MLKFACKDAGVDCDYVATGETAEAVKENAFAHAGSCGHSENYEPGTVGITDQGGRSQYQARIARTPAGATAATNDGNKKGPGSPRVGAWSTVRNG